MPCPTGRWFATADPRPDAARRLFLFPHAGGSAASYLRWCALLPDVEVLVAQLPGRQERRAEEPYRRTGPLVEALRTALEAELDGRPYALFGHSLGALLAYRLAVDIERDGGEVPVLLGVSGWAPERVLPVEALLPLPDARFVTAVRRFGVLPAEVSEDPELLALVLPALRADLALVAGYRDDGARVGCPVAAYGGRADPTLERGRLSEWAARTPVFLGASAFPGGHFYLADHAIAIASDLARHLQRTEGDDSIAHRKRHDSRP
ncbi:alpha/beta fold hydrolase [Streptomyces boncukensis]|uniref:Thioesterase n=1 Tax=Streptomyces boncukensis TaxID=2711219 RepID=A0A6G4WQE2_9ACTN|nr:thioesterase [Streptomyces boncukensis]